MIDFVKQLPVLIDSEDGPQLTRDAILQLAVQGKLVPQDSSDEPASDLLKKIEAKKTQLVEEKKIKKSKPLPPIESDKAPFEIPGGWAWAKLGNLLTIVTGKKDVNEGHEDGLYPFFSCAAKPLKSNVYSFDCKAILVPGNGANVGMTMFYQGKFEAYQRTYVLMDFFKVVARYIRISLDANFIKSITGKQYGSAINYIRLGNLTNFLVPLPPLAEQHRIVEKVDELMAQCDAIEAQLQTVQDNRNTFAKAICDALLTDNSTATPSPEVVDMACSVEA